MNAPQTECRSAEPIYVYAIVPSGPEGRSPIAGMEALAGGIGTIGEGRYSAVVGGSRAENLQGRPREELGHLLVAHQQVIEQLIRAAPVLPVKFGTQAPDEMTVRKALERGGRLFETAFAELEGCTQLEILSSPGTSMRYSPTSPWRSRLPGSRSNWREMRWTRRPQGGRSSAGW